jgi:hypothetical protein
MFYIVVTTPMIGKMVPGLARTMGRRTNLSINFP